MTTDSNAVRDAIDLLESRADRLGDKPLLLWEPFEGPAATWSYGQFLDQVRRVAAGLSAHGVMPGDRVLLHTENCPEFLLTWFACAWLGAVCVVINPRSSGPELAYFAQRTGAVGAVTQVRSVATVAVHCADLEWIVAIGDADGADEVLAASRPVEAFSRLSGVAAPRARPDPGCPSSMMFTSGTTSRPKAVVWSRANAIWAAQSGAANTALTPDDIALVFLPLYHVVGLAWSVLPALHAGATIVLQPRFSASRFWAVAQARRASFASHVQFSIGVLSRQPAPDKHFFRHWASSTWLPDYERYFGVPILGWWGMTETVAPGIMGRAGVSQQPGTIGRAAPGYGVRLVNERNELIAASGTGEMLVQGRRGETIFSEYFGEPQATAEAFTDDGWFRTGDRMKRHDDGSIQFIERSRDVIKTGGEGFSPADVERVIRQVEGVRAAALVARPDPTYGEVGVAFVVPGDGAASPEALMQRIRQACESELASFKVPREIRIVTELPLAGLNKVAKGELRRRALTAVDQQAPSSHG